MVNEYRHVRITMRIIFFFLTLINELMNMTTWIIGELSLDDSVKLLYTESVYKLNSFSFSFNANVTYLGFKYATWIYFKSFYYIDIKYYSILL